MLNNEFRMGALTRLGRALSDPNRARILFELANKPSYPAELAANLGLTRSNVSNHLACLRGCGLVTTQIEGRRTRYQLIAPALAAALKQLVESAQIAGTERHCQDACCAGPTEAPNNLALELAL